MQISAFGRKNFKKSVCCREQQAVQLLLMSAQQLKNAFIELFKGISELSKCKKNNSFYDFSCTLFCPLGQNEL
ncbi:MAG: hypothetical protein IKP25_07865, partial [Ruminococcus sp.]|nr:hypothetical protein [Ruminococcus sp.]